MFPIEPYRESLPDMPAMTVTPFDRMFQSARLSQNVRDVRIVPNVRDLPNAPMVLPVTIATRQNRQRRTLVLPHAQNLPKRTHGSDGRSIAGLPHAASGGLHARADGFDSSANLLGRMLTADGHA